MINKDKLLAYAQLMRIDRPIGSLLLLWPTLWSLYLSAYIQGVSMPDISLMLVFGLGVLLMRSAGCVINDYADRHFDGHVKRTQNRPLPAGCVSAKEALLLFAVLIVCSFLLVLTLNKLTIMLSFVGAALAAAYPFMKRWIPLPQLVLGCAFGWAIPMAWAAQCNQLSPMMWWLFLTNILWTIVYDTQYAMVDRDDDLKIGIKSSAIFFGRLDRLVIAGLQVLVIFLLFYIGQMMALAVPFYVCLAVAAGLFIYQQQLIRFRERDSCFQAFLNNNLFGFVVSIGVILG